MRFADIQGQEYTKERLRRSIDEGRIAHAQIFVGLAGAGTLPLAIAYAQYLNCTDRTAGDSCGICPSCRKIADLVHPDLHFVFPSAKPSGWKSSTPPSSDDFLPQWREIIHRTGGYFTERMWYDELGFENQQGFISRRDADEVLRKLGFKAFEARYKIVIIWLPELMRTEAANVLLKILEEPWERTLFLLVSEHTEQMLPTILSRVQQTYIPYDGKVDPLRTEVEGEDFERFASLMRMCYSNNHLAIFGWVDETVILGRESIKRFLDYSISMLRASYMETAGLQEISYLWGGEESFVNRFAPFITNQNIEQLVAECERALRDIAQNGNPRVVLTHFALTISKMIN